jgi:FAD/FMN-containing dehydrogenase
MSATLRRLPQTNDFLNRLRDIVGVAHVLTDAQDTLPYLDEPRGLWHGQALCVVRPGCTEEVSGILALCDSTGHCVVPQGGNTGLVGGQVPDCSGKQVVLSLTRMNRIREVDPGSNTATVDAGVILAQLHAAAEAADRLFPLSLASEGSCTIGGNLATNAGGTAVLAYGNARDLVIGLEVVLADGRVLSGLSKLRKDNTGYDLRNLFVGSEGTLGIITAAVVKLFPRPRAMATAFIGLASPQHCLDLLLLAQSIAGPDLKTFEFMPQLGLDMVAGWHPKLSVPLPDRHDWYVLMELASPAQDGLADTMIRLLAAAADQGIVENAVVALSLEQRTLFWRWREYLPDAQQREGGSIKHDISVPVALVPRFLEQALRAAGDVVPGARPVPFGHLGDGNVHFNVSQPVGADRDGFLARWSEMNVKIHAIVVACGGSISAEHGIGVLKRDLLPDFKDKVALDVMRVLKRTLDPHGTLNPGKVL